MPIYAYACTACGHQKDVLQKLSDAPLTDCPACGQPSFAKQVTAAGFQLKGSGWYVTDFRNPAQTTGSAAKPTTEAGASSAAPSAESAAPAAASPAAPAASDSSSSKP